MRGVLIHSATLFGVGRWPWGPGTWGTLVTVPLAVALAWVGPLWHMIFVLTLVPVSIVAAEFYEQDGGAHDPKEIVIDEMLGYLIAMTWLPFTWQSFVAGFFLFRVLDIWKPFPISIFDRKVKGGLGTVIDDVVAGVLVNLLLQWVARETHLLGVRTIVVSS